MRNILHIIILIITTTVGASASAESLAAQFRYSPPNVIAREFQLDSVSDYLLFGLPYPPLLNKYSPRLTDADYREVAAQLGVEVAAIKAVVDIETGNRRQGFWKPGKAIINFDNAIFAQYAPSHGIDVAETSRLVPIIFEAIDIEKYGSRQAAMYARLAAAKAVNKELAYESCFWGMFQIGGFNWIKCGAVSLQQFVDMMNRSEHDQLQLFAAYCRSRDLIKYIQAKDWAEFSLRYNGPGYKRLGYDSRMAAAYARHKAAEQHEISNL